MLFVKPEKEARSKSWFLKKIILYRDFAKTTDMG